MRYRVSFTDDAPDGVGPISLGGYDISEVPFETDDRNILGNVSYHPWLQAEAVDEDANDQDVPVPEKSVEERAQEVDRPTSPGSDHLPGGFDEEEAENSTSASDYDHSGGTE